MYRRIQYGACLSGLQAESSVSHFPPLSTAEMSRTSYICVQLQSTPATKHVVPPAPGTSNGAGMGHVLLLLRSTRLPMFPAFPQETETEQNRKKTILQEKDVRSAVHNSSVLTRALQAVLIALLKVLYIQIHKNKYLSDQGPEKNRVYLSILTGIYMFLYVHISRMPMNL